MKMSKVPGQGLYCSAAGRKRPNIKDAGGRWTVCIAFGQCDFTVDDDRAIPMARAALQVGDLSPFFGVVDAQSPLWIVDICEAVSDHWARAAIRVFPNLHELATCEIPSLGAAAIRDDQPCLSVVFPYRAGREHPCAGRRGH